MHGDWAKMVDGKDAAFGSVTRFKKEDARMVNESAKSEAAMLAWLVPTLRASAGALALLLGFVMARSMVKGLNRIASTMALSSMQVGGASQELASASQMISDSATEGAASLEQTMSTMDELSATVKNNAESANEASTLSQESRGLRGAEQ
ncbi:MAG: hypothetical protein MO853_12215 [Candidatus Protistobacter heckmanni]|nr:hypothetical protein [Candidatus Protistobacter heckmanni]